MPCRVFAGLSAALHERDDFDGVGAAQHGLCALVARHDGTVHLDRHASRVRPLRVMSSSTLSGVAMSSGCPLMIMCPSSVAGVIPISATLRCRPLPAISDRVRRVRRYEKRVAGASRTL